MEIPAFDIFAIVLPKERTGHNSNELYAIKAI